MDKITHKVRCEQWTSIIKECLASGMPKTCLLYTSDAADEEDSVDFGGSRNIYKKKKNKQQKKPSQMKESN